jgi:metal-dependent amidase/aminoacylase/carboxypeptidase family protein
MARDKIPGTIRIWPGTAEELVGTKAYFVRAGLFNDVDVALFTHVVAISRSRGARQAARGWSRWSTPSKVVGY